MIIEECEKETSGIGFGIQYHEISTLHTKAQILLLSGSNKDEARLVPTPTTKSTSLGSLGHRRGYPMPENYVKEMICDWRAMERDGKQSAVKYYEKTKKACSYMKKQKS